MLTLLVADKITSLYKSFLTLVTLMAYLWTSYAHVNMALMALKMLGSEVGVAAFLAVEIFNSHVDFLMSQKCTLFTICSCAFITFVVSDFKVD